VEEGERRPYLSYLTSNVSSCFESCTYHGAAMLPGRGQKGEGGGQLANGTAKPTTFEAMLRWLTLGQM
jgi:hypothetical protein